jgi:hypothetical protein
VERVAGASSFVARCAVAAGPPARSSAPKHDLRVGEQPAMSDLMLDV